MEKLDGGPAFPTLGNVGYNSDWLSDDGMSLRDHFAAQAISSVIDSCKGDTIMDGESRVQMFARKAYEIADAMLEARNVR